MKRMIWAVVLGVCVSGVNAVQAQDVRFGYVDARKVLNDSKAGKRLRAELEKTTKQRQETLARDEQRLKGLQEAYEKDKLLLSETQKQAKQKEFDEKLRAFQKSAAAAQQELEQKKNEFERKAIGEIQTIVRELAKEEKLTLVFEKNQMPVLYAAEGPDLTDKVLKRFDAKAGG
jgi:outer membrane protein